MHTVRRKRCAKKDTRPEKYVLVAYKDILECRVHHEGELTRPKSLVPGATVKTIVYGEVTKGTVVSTSDNKESLEIQADDFDVGRFLGLSRKRKSLIKGGLQQKLHSKPEVDLSTDNLTSTPTSSKIHHHLVQDLPSPIQSIGNKTEYTPKTASSSNSKTVLDESTENIQDIDISLVDISYDDGTPFHKSTSQDNPTTTQLNARRSINFHPSTADVSMAFSSFSSSLVSLLTKLKPFIESYINNLNETVQDVAPILKEDIVAADDHITPSDRQSKSADFASLGGNLTFRVETEISSEEQLPSIQESLASTIPTESVLDSQKPMSTTNIPGEISCAESPSDSTTNISYPHIESSFSSVSSLTDTEIMSITSSLDHCLSMDDSTILYGLDTMSEDSLEVQCTSPRSTPDRDDSFYSDDRADSFEVNGLNPDSISDVFQTKTDNRHQSLVETHKSVRIPETTKLKSPVQSSLHEAINSRKYDLDNEGDVHMMTILDSLRPEPRPLSTSIPDFEERALYTNVCNSAISDLSSLENIQPAYHRDETIDLDDDGVEIDDELFLQMTPTEFFYGLMLRPDYPPRIDTNSSFTRDEILHLKSISNRPEVFARNLLYRMFTLAEFKNSSVYGRGFTNGITNSALDGSKVTLIRELTFELYSDFSWRNCVLWMDKSIRYVNKLV